MKKWLIGITLAISLLFTGITSTKNVSASTVETPSIAYSVSSLGFPVKIYHDPECTQYSGQTLATTISDWKVIQQSIDYQTDMISAYNLGNNAWVKANEVFRSTGKGDNANIPMGIAYAYSGGQKIPVYDSPQLWHVTGYLDPKIDKWAITQYTLSSPDANSINRVDLGHNQWVDATHGVSVIRAAMIFSDGTPLYNLNGQQTGVVSGTYGYYKVFDAATINGATYVKLGSDNQWAAFAQGAVN
ncbi:hypothetical protein ACNAN0_02115 [Agrilactobacillus fermenti]|uniref:hypothetical protein n=1 Tax=Agrilactobacillus fermenti TaxID=2586909 RepID=UPI003A5C729E